MIPPVPKEPKAPKYWSHVPQRHPSSKFHTNLGHAKNALSQKFYVLNDGKYHGPDMSIYEMGENGEWVALYAAKFGDSELPWKEGERAKQEEAERLRKEREEKAELAEIRRLAEAEWRRDFGGEYSQEFERFLSGYTAGYLSAKKKYQVGSRWR